MYYVVLVMLIFANRKKSNDTRDNTQTTDINLEEAAGQRGRGPYPPPLLKIQDVVRSAVVDTCRRQAHLSHPSRQHLEQHKGLVTIVF